MYSDLKGYEPNDKEFLVQDQLKELFPQELDFAKAKGVKANSVLDAIKVIGDNFTATFPAGETAMRKLDDFEIYNIREEYCVMQEEEVPKRKQELEETLEEIKVMKKRAEQAYDSILAEVAKYAAEVKAGVKEVQLVSKETFCIALAGHWLIYTYDRKKKVFVLAKALEVQDASEIWANEEKNREAMFNLFGLEFPETSKPEQEDDNAEDLPFGE